MRNLVNFAKRDFISTGSGGGYYSAPGVRPIPDIRPPAPFQPLPGLSPPPGYNPNKVPGRYKGTYVTAPLDSKNPPAQKATRQDERWQNWLCQRNGTRAWEKNCGVLKQRKSFDQQESSSRCGRISA